MWSDGHLEFFVATITRVAKALTFQQWPSEWIGKVPRGKIATVSQKMMRVVLRISSQPERLWQSEVEMMDLLRSPRSHCSVRRSEKFEWILNRLIGIVALSSSGENCQNHPRGADFSKQSRTIPQTIGQENEIHGEMSRNSSDFKIVDSSGWICWFNKILGSANVKWNPGSSWRVEKIATPD
jgi:hypothetical protein